MPSLLQPLQPDRSAGDRPGTRAGPGFGARPRRGDGQHQLEGAGGDRGLTEEAPPHSGRPAAAAGPCHGGSRGPVPRGVQTGAGPEDEEGSPGEGEGGRRSGREELGGMEGTKERQRETKREQEGKEKG